jgi:uncharacterized protein DUF6896
MLPDGIVRRRVACRTPEASRPVYDGSAVASAASPDQLRALIDDYIAAVARAVAVLRGHFGDIDFLRAIVSRQVRRVGRIGQVSYEFHGVGCWVRLGDCEVDFDFGPGGRHDGFDAWRLHLFAEQSVRHQALSELDRVEAGLEVLALRGVVHAPRLEPSRHLWYLVDS